MSRFLRLVLRVARDRMERGESPEEILRDYPRLTEGEREALRRGLCGERIFGRDGVSPLVIPRECDNIVHRPLKCEEHSKEPYIEENRGSRL